ncbi:MAG: hypothetical protein AVDCRST_MAG91-3870, partial [uncultured Sphingomonadaceae bacterium]
RSALMSEKSPRCRIEQLAWSDPDLGSIDLPKRRMEVRAGFGSGLALRPGDPPGTFWAVCDRGPNLKVKTMVKRFGADKLEALREHDGAKIMPRTDLGPSIAEMRIDGDSIHLVRTIRISSPSGEPLSGIPIPGGAHAKCEPAFDLEGKPLEPDPSGLDSEGIAALRGGGFWIGDEYGPSLLRLDEEGRVQFRWLPAGSEASLEGAAYPCQCVLPAIAGKRQLNRGFEAIALSPDERWLYLAFQSPLAHPDEEAHEKGCHARLWKLDAATGEVAAQFIYPLDPPESFRRDCEKGPFGRSDIKVSEIAAEREDVLILLERGSETTKFYRVALDAGLAAPAAHLDVATRPCIEELSGEGGEIYIPVLEKQLLLSTDAFPEVAADLEGLVILSPTEMLLVNDNDFGVEGAETSFWRVTFDEPIFGG